PRPASSPGTPRPFRPSRGASQSRNPRDVWASAGRRARSWFRRIVHRPGTRPERIRSSRGIGALPFAPGADATEARSDEERVTAEPRTRGKVRRAKKATHLANVARKRAEEAMRLCLALALGSVLVSAPVYAQDDDRKKDEKTGTGTSMDTGDPAYTE